MAAVIKTHIVKIGNSHVIIIPKSLIDRMDIEEEVELELQQNRIVIRPMHRPRAGWEEQFKAMAEAGDDKLLDGNVLLPTAWDEEEWEW